MHAWHISSPESPPYEAEVEGETGSWDSDWEIGEGRRVATL